jgi:hypothetical protein
MGFANVAEYAAADEAGQCWFTQFRKTVSSAATLTNGWIDYSYFPGSPIANFYASTPATAAVLERDKGIRVPTVSPATQHVNRLTVMTANTTTAVNSRQSLILLDYLLCYPFLDTDAVGEEQTCYNTSDDPLIPSIPRYSGGSVIAVAQAASSALGTFTFTYTNQDGTPGKVSQDIRVPIVSGGGQLIGAQGAGASYNPFLPLALGDREAQSIQSVTFSVGGGGLMALVIVKPIVTHRATQECRTTSGVAFGAADEVISLVHRPGAARVIDGAILNFIGQGPQGSLASSQLVGTLETHWGG